MNRRIHVAALITALVSCGCGGKSGPSGPATPADVLTVAGTYPTRATVIAGRNTCGNVTVQDHPTIVRHTPGATSISLEHAGSTYSGTIDSAGTFSTPPANFAFPGADYSIGITGAFAVTGFTATGFTATVELTKRAGGQTCTYAVGWVGTR